MDLDIGPELCFVYLVQWDAPIILSGLVFLVSHMTCLKGWTLAPTQWGRFCVVVHEFAQSTSIITLAVYL